jgi:3-deoxy-manno-octulosonate cytidylyltransferase (CMP-KDO synthetase)
MKVLGVIPARMAASRFPGKPLASIAGIPMIGHCYFRSRACGLIDELFVATCDAAIIDYMESIGGKAVMTSDVHERASERTAEALLRVEEITGMHFDIILMIQGDEPLVEPDMLAETIEPLLQGSKMVSNLMTLMKTDEERDDPNNVKVVVDREGRAMYMSRENIPSKKKYTGNIDVYRQLGLIAFTREALLKFVALETSTLEKIESVDMNRFLENAIPVHMRLTDFEADAVDTPADLARVQEKMKTNIFFRNTYGAHAY